MYQPRECMTQTFLQPFYNLSTACRLCRAHITMWSCVAHSKLPVRFAVQATALDTKGDRDGDSARNGGRPLYAASGCRRNPRAPWPNHRDGMHCWIRFSECLDRRHESHRDRQEILAGPIDEVIVFRVPNIMRRVMRCHDFRSGREASRSPYREYGQGSRQSHGRKLVPALRVRAKIARAPQRGAGAPWGCDRTGAKPVPRIRRAMRPAAGSHPSMKRLEPAPPYAGHFVGRVAHIGDMSCAVLLVRTAARNRGPACGDVTAEVRVESRASVRFCPGYGVASKHTSLGTCSALRGTHNFGRNAHVPHYVRHS